jgi:DNA-binding NtrC family response regulator
MGHKMHRILIIDDEEAILFSYRMLFRGPLVKVDTCTSVEEALELVQVNDYHAVITDLRFGDSEDQGGLELLQYLREHRPATPVILATGYGNDEIKEKVLTLGVTAYFDKPVSVEEILACLNDLGIPAGET